MSPQIFSVGDAKCGHGGVCSTELDLHETFDVILAALFTVHQSFKIIVVALWKHPTSNDGFPNLFWIIRLQEEQKPQCRNCVPQLNGWEIACMEAPAIQVVLLYLETEGIPKEKTGHIRVGFRHVIFCRHEVNPVNSVCLILNVTVPKPQYTL